LACGLPVVAFASTGLVDVVDHKVTGYLAKPFDTEELAFGIQWILENQQDSAKLRYASRQRAVDLFSYPVIAKQYQAVYQQAIDQNADSN
jgi:glycosyltransferase involved in cell wall biosynthesis